MNVDRKYNNQKGVSLIIVFFIMVVMLSIVLSLSVMLFEESKNTRNILDSLTAFYIADSGVEKALYFSRQVIPVSTPEVVSGICNICTSCLSDDCQECQAQGGEEGCGFCRNCKISYFTEFNGKRSETIAYILPNGDYYNLDISVKGTYRGTTRALGLQIANKDLSSSNPIISQMLAVRQGGFLNISAVIEDVDGISEDFPVKAHIRDSNDEAVDDVAVVNLSSSGGSQYTGTWENQSGYYFLYIRACDLNNNCANSSIFAITE